MEKNQLSHLNQDLQRTLPLFSTPGLEGNCLDVILVMNRQLLSTARETNLKMEPSSFSITQR